MPQDYVDQIGAFLPELSDEKKARFTQEFGISTYDAGILVAKGRDAKLAANWAPATPSVHSTAPGRKMAGSLVTAAALREIIAKHVSRS